MRSWQIAVKGPIFGVRLAIILISCGCTHGACRPESVTTVRAEFVITDGNARKYFCANRCVIVELSRKWVWLVANSAIYLRHGDSGALARSSIFSYLSKAAGGMLQRIYGRVSSMSGI